MHTLRVCDYVLHVCIYSGPCILRPPIQPGKYGIKLEVVSKSRDIYSENIRVVSLISGLKIEEIVNGGFLNCRDHCTCTSYNLYARKCPNRHVCIVI